MKVALGVRAQYMIVLTLSLLMVTQIIGVAIFSGKAQATSTATFVRSIPDSSRPANLYQNFTGYQGSITEGPDNYIYMVTGDRTVNKLNLDGSYVSTITLSLDINASDIAVASTGDLYVLENNDYGTNQNSVREFNSSGTYQSVIVGYNTFDTMRQIELDASDNIYVMGSTTTKKYTSAGSLLGSWNVGGYRFAVDSNIVYSTYSGCFVRRLDTGTGAVTSFGGCGTGSGQFTNTGGLDVDAAGDVFVSDMTNDRVQVFDGAGSFDRSFGGSGVGAGQLLNSLAVAYKNDMLITGNSNILVGDEFNNRIQVFALAGSYVGELRDTFASPSDMAIGPSGSMYVVDKQNHRIKKINKATGAQLAVWGSYGSGDSQFKFDAYSYVSRTGIAVDSQENVYVVDTDNHRIQKFNSSGTYLTEWGADGLGLGEFDTVTDIAIDSTDRVYTLETGYQMYRVQRFDSIGQSPVRIGSGSQFNEPRTLAIAPDDTLYVADVNGSSQRIQVFTAAGSFDRNIAPGSVGEFNSMAVDARGNLLVSNYNYIAGLNSIYRISTAGTFATEQILGISTGTGDGQLFGVNGLLADDQGNFYASDNYGRVQMFHNASSKPLDVVTRPATNISQTSAKMYLQTTDLHNSLGATYSFEYGSTSSYGQVLAAGTTQVVEDSQIPFTGGPTVYYGGYGGIDRQGNVYRILSGDLFKYNSNHEYELQVGTGNNQFGSTYTNMAFDSLGNVYVAGQQDNVEKYGPDGTFLYAVSVPYYLAKIAIDSADNLYVLNQASYGVSTVMKYNSSGELDAQFNSPVPASVPCGGSIAIDSVDNLYVVSSDCNPGTQDVIAKLRPNGQSVTQWNIAGGGKLYIDSDDIIYISGQAQYTSSGAALSSSAQLPYDSFGMSGSNWLYDIDVARGVAYVADVGINNLLTYARKNSAQLDNLPCGTTYHYRAKAVVGSDTVYGDDQTFTTGACNAPPPDVTTTNVDGELTSRTLHGTYTPPAGVTEYGFEFGLTTGYGQQLLNDSNAYSHGLSRQWGSAGSDDGQFGSATYIAVTIEADSEGNTYVLDPENSRIQKFNVDGDFVLKWGSSGGGNYDMDGAKDMAMNGAGNILVLYGDPSMVREYTPSGVYVGSWTVPEYYPYYNSRLDVGDDGSVYILYGGALNYYDIIRKFTSVGVNTGVVWNVGYSGAGDLTVTNDRVYALTGSKRISEFDLAGTLIAAHVDFPDQGFNVYSMNRLTSDEDGFIYASSWLVGRKYDQNLNIVSEWQSDARYGIAVNKDLGYIYSVGGNSNNAVVYQYAPAITATASGLVCATEYHYRAYAVNAAGTAYGDDATYTTESCANITTTSLDIGYENNSYYELIETENLNGGNTYSIISGTLPTGLSLDVNSGAISGTPEYGTGGDYTFTVELSDAMGDTTQEVSLYITPHDPFQIGTSYLADGRVGDAYSDYLNFYGPIGPVAAEVISGTLPPGITMDVTGEFSGTPTTAGTYDFRVRATDMFDSAETDLSIEVLPALVPPEPRANTPIVTITSPPSNTVFSYTDDDLTVTGTGPANQTITMYIDGYQLGTTTSDDDGNWSYTANDVFPGDHVFEAKWIPIKDVAFIPFNSYPDFAPEIRIIDTASRQVVKKVFLPQNFAATGAAMNHAGTKLYTTGADVATGEAFVWEFDISTGVLTRSLSVAYSNISFTPGPLLITADDNYGYLNNITEDGFELIKLDLATMTVDGAPLDVPMSGDDWNNRSGFISSSPTPLMALAGQSAYVSASINNDNAASLTAINLLNQQISSVPTALEPRDDQNYNLITASGGMLYSIINDKLVTVDPTSNTAISTVVIDEFDQEYNIPMSLAVDSAQGKAYVGVALGLYIIELDTGDAELISLDDDPEFSVYPIGIQLTSDSSQLYIASFYGSIRILDTQTKLLIPTSNLQATELTGIILAYGDYVGRIVAPTASTTFSVDMAPEIECPDCIPPIVCDDCDPEPPEEPTITDVTPAPGSPAQARTSPLRAPQATVTPQNSLLALAARIPQPIALGFPWLLLLLALVLVSAQYYQVHAESASTKRLQDSVASQNRLVDEQNNFVALSTHYIHTPLTVMEGEISLMVKAGTISQETATKLQATLASLSAEAESVLAQEEQNEVK